MKCKKCGYETDVLDWTCPCSWLVQGVPEMYRWANLDDFKNPQNDMDCLRDNRLLYTYGPAGVGKTHEAYALAKWARAHLGGTFVVLRGQVMSGPMMKFPTAYEDYVMGAWSAKVLIIDEYNDAFYDVVDKRITEGRHTLITSNEAPIKFGERFQSRVQKAACHKEGVDVRGTDKAELALEKNQRVYADWLGWQDEMSIEMLKKKAERDKRLRALRRPQ